MGDGTSLSTEEFYEENNWINTEDNGAFQDEVDKVYAKSNEKPIDFRSTFQPTDLTMRLFWSYKTKDGRELVARTKATVNNFKYKENFHQKSSIPFCIICGCKFLMPNVYMCVYEHKDDDTMTVRMEYSDSMDQACFYHFLEDGVDKGRCPYGPKRK